VLLTGPNGFVGAHVLDQLLQHNYRVRGTVRSLSKATFLQTKYPQAYQNGDLTFIAVPDIQAPGALDSAAQGVDFICHVASPFFTSTVDPIKDLVEPAVNGTRSVIHSALKSTTLKKMTILSSFASVVDMSQGARPGYVYTAEDWDPVTSAQAAQDGYYGYFASKTFAERAAWDMWKEAKAKGEVSWDLVTFCPPMIYGPPYHEVHEDKGVEGLNTSLKGLIVGLRGEDPAFRPKVATPGLPAWVDVRDVAEAHVRALALENGVSERFLLCGG
ncbi:NAD(P)-binding protein, partial [Aaosphaeria arxii CBS 175.79]